MAMVWVDDDLDDAGAGWPYPVWMGRADGPGHAGWRISLAYPPAARLPDYVVEILMAEFCFRLRYPPDPPLLGKQHNKSDSPGVLRKWAVRLS